MGQKIIDYLHNLWHFLFGMLPLLILWKVQGALAHRLQRRLRTIQANTNKFGAQPSSLPLDFNMADKAWKRIDP